MLIQRDPEISFAKERALLLLRQVAPVATGVLASVPQTLIRPTLFVLDARDGRAQQLLELAPDSSWLAGLRSSEGINVFALEFRNAYDLLTSFDRALLDAASSFEGHACLVVTEGAFAFLDYQPKAKHRSARALN